MSEMTYKQIENLVEQDAVVLFPVGIIEEHGPHLPLGTDIFQGRLLSVKKRLWHVLRNILKILTDLVSKKL